MDRGLTWLVEQLNQSCRLFAPGSSADAVALGRHRATSTAAAGAADKSTAGIPIVSALRWWYDFFHNMVLNIIFNQI